MVRKFQNCWEILQKTEEIKLVKAPASTLTCANDDFGMKLGKIVFTSVEKFETIWKKQQKGHVKQTSPMNTALGGAWAGTSENLTEPEQQYGGEAAILD